jgi:hypothetical protein
MACGRRAKLSKNDFETLLRNAAKRGSEDARMTLSMRFRSNDSDPGHGLLPSAPSIPLQADHYLAICCTPACRQLFLSPRRAPRSLGERKPSSPRQRSLRPESLAARHPRQPTSERLFMAASHLFRTRRWASGVERSDFRYQRFCRVLGSSLTTCPSVSVPAARCRPSSPRAQNWASARSRRSVRVDRRCFFARPHIDSSTAEACRLASNQPCSGPRLAGPRHHSASRPWPRRCHVFRHL